jgi:hypothetical protein
MKRVEDFQEVITCVWCNFVLFIECVVDLLQTGVGLLNLKQILVRKRDKIAKRKPDRLFLSANSV